MWAVMTDQARAQPQAAGVAARAAALRLLDAVLRKGLPLESALDSAARGLDRADDRALAHALAAEVLRRLPDLDALIDGATTKPLPRDAKARMALRIALAQALQLGTPRMPRSPRFCPWSMAGRAGWFMASSGPYLAREWPCRNCRLCLRA